MSDLVAEIQLADRKRRRRRTIRLLIVLAVVAVLAVLGKLAFDRVRVDRGLEEVAAALGEDTHAALTDARTSLAQLRDLAPDDERVAGATALVLAQDALVWGGSAADAREAAQADAPDAHVARAMVLLMDGDVDEGTKVLAAVDSAELLVTGHYAYARGLLALARPLDGERLSAARAALPVDKADAALLYARLAVALAFRAGELGPGMEAVGRLRKRAPAHLGVAVDEAVGFSLQHENADGVRTAAAQLAETADPTALSARDRGRAHLARALANVHDAQPDDAKVDLEQALAVLPAWDWDARDRAVTALRRLGEAEAIEALASKDSAEAAAPSKLAAGLYEAAASLARGDVIEALRQLEGLPQDHPEVAALQGLALVEQRRFPEAGPWLERAETFFPGRAELEVARLRADVAEAKPEVAKESIAKLMGLAEAHPGTPRLWTGIGEARLRSEDKDELLKARAAFSRALEVEAAPAEAAYQLALLDQAAAKSDPEKLGSAMALLERAAKENQSLARYRQAHGLLAFRMGREDEARGVLESLRETPGVAPEAALALTTLYLRDAPAKEAVAKAREGVTWAEELGASALDLAVARAELALASEDDGAIAAAQAELVPLVPEHPKRIELRLAFAKMLAREDPDAAMENLRAGIRRAGRPGNGRFYMLWARLERPGGSRSQRIAAKHAKDGWDRVREDDLPARDILEEAKFAIETWLMIKRASMARRIGFQLTRTLPLYPEAWTYRANLERRTDNLAKAVEIAARAVALPGAGAAAHAEHGACLASTGSIDNAREAYDKAIKLATTKAQTRAYEKARKRL